ncbi:hypothetical protein QCA50_011303 [Cerrena zonata]|uniref:DUF6533 domain-containing protein n=1 Tax=Cerrena zonata TaxID=2478898 RepID=A0AAW0FW59_9APHY
MSARSKAATHYLQFDIQWASIALLFFDYALTFPLEVKYIWRYKYQHSLILYIFCRYALLANVLYLLAIAGKISARYLISYGLSTLDMRLTRKPLSCDTAYKFIGAISVLGRAAVIVTFTLRTYIVYGRNRLILAYLSLLGVTCVALDITHVPGLRCVGSSSIPIVVSLFTTAAVILNFRAPSGFFQRLLNALTLPLSGLLTARFLLHLRRFANSAVRLDGKSESTTSGTTSGTVSSFHALGNMATSTLDDFGDDPVARVKNTRTTTDVEKASAMITGSQSSNTDGTNTMIGPHSSGSSAGPVNHVM